MEKIIKKAGLGEWVAKFEGDDVFAPAFADAVWNFAKVEAPGAIELDHTNTVRSVKEFAFPQREVFYTFEHERGGVPKVTPTLPAPNTTVVLGVRPCDGRGMPRNDKVFTVDFKDPYYWARRDAATLVGLACNHPHSPNCFCLAVGGSPHSEDGLDILMTDLGDRFHVKALTEKGQALVKKGGSLLTDTAKADQDEVAKVHAASHKHTQRSIKDLGSVAERLKANFDSPEWETMAKACIGCGICTFLCPTCHCFDINDEVTCQTPCKGERVRTWDNCQFPDFTMHTSGHNPRHDLGSRLRQRVSHKFLYFVENHKTQQCTGCGRCISECPVGIDIVAVLDRVAKP